MKRYVTSCILHFHGKITRFIVIISFLVCSINAYAVTNNLPDCSQTTVNNAISAAANGDTLVCPAGSWSWSDVNITKNITLQGAGIGNTNISITAQGGIESPTSYSGVFRVTGFTFTSTANFGMTTGLMRIFNNQGWRVDHNRFEVYSNVQSYAGGNGIYTQGPVGGLIDHNYFTNAPNMPSGACSHAMIYPTGDGNNDWLNYGTQLNSPTRTIFIEDNQFYTDLECTAHNNHAVYGQIGGMWVFRHNTVHNMNADAHGFCASWSTREYEISNNVFTWSYNGHSNIHPRGGTGVIYGNSFGSGASYAFEIEDYRVGGGAGGCSGTMQSNVPGYGNVSASSACPEYGTVNFCAQMIGRGQNNSYDPLYIWGNTGTSAITNPDSSYIQSGRDYILNQGAKPGYVSYPYPHPLQDGSEPSSSPPPGNLTPNPPSIIGVN